MPLPRLLLVLLLSGCAAVSARSDVPLPTVPRVDLPRYMGDWHLIASIPLKAEEGGYNIKESYALNRDGSVAVRFRKREANGELKTREFTGFPKPETGNAVWGMRIVWPFKADYRIVHLEPDYSVVLIGRNKRDHAWILARKPELPEPAYQRYKAQFAAMGYDVSKFVRFEQRWPEP